MTNDNYHTESENDFFVSEPAGTWGGDWTEEKLDAFEKYVKAYLKIMGKYAPQFGWKLLYFDGFAGSGSREVPEKDETDNTLVEEFASEEECQVYKGAAERVLSIEGFSFDHYVFVDKNKESISQLESKLRENFPDKKMDFRSDDANVQVKKMAEGLSDNDKFASLVLLDPFGMQLDWETISSLKSIKHLDLWILVPSGVIINRLLDRKGELQHIEKLCKTLGVTPEEIKQECYETKVEQTLFGEVEVTSKRKKSINKIADLYMRKLKTIFEHVAEPLPLLNTRNCPIFHFVFASNNRTAAKIASQIIGKKSK